MTWREWQYARQLLAEESAGRHVRAAQAEEDEAFQRSQKALSKTR